MKYLLFRTVYFCFFATVLLLFVSCGTETKPEFRLTVTAEPNEAGQITSSAETAQEGEMIQISVTENEHWVFTGWAGDLTGTENKVVNVYMDRDRTITALFEKVEYPITVEIEGEGSVIQEIISARSQTTDYPHATILRLTAVPEFGWRFTGWEGDSDSVDENLDVEVEGPAHYIARFERIDFNVTIQIEGEGDVKQEFVLPKVLESEYPFETVLMLTAEPARGWYFSGWSGDLTSDESMLTIEIEEDLSLIAQFERLEFEITLEKSGEGDVILMKDGNPTDLRTFPFESELEIVATPSNGWEFIGWQGDIIAAENPITIRLEEDLSLTALFDRQSFVVSVNITGDGMVYQNGVPGAVQRHPFGSEVVVRAEAGVNWVFAGFRGAVSSDYNPISLVVDGNVELQVQFSSVPQQKRILPLGDSITNGFPYSYRFFLHEKLVAAGYSFTFVGSQDSNPAGYPGNWNTRHEGHNGASSRGINADLSVWLQFYQPDIALIHLGTNDISYSILIPAEFTLSYDHMESIISKLRTKNPLIRIHLAQIIPAGTNIGLPEDQYKELTNSWNREMSEIAQRLSTSVSPIYIVDMNSGFSDADLLDGIHPNETGAEKMAVRWFNSLINNQ